MAEKGGYPYEPDYVVPPGCILEDYMQTWGLGKDELAQRSGLSIDLIEGVLAGDAPLNPDTALKLEEIFELKAVVWLGIEEDYREGLKQGKKVPDLAKEPAV